METNTYYTVLHIRVGNNMSVKMGKHLHKKLASLQTIAYNSQWN